MTEDSSHEALKKRIGELEKEVELCREAVAALRKNENEMRAILDAVTETIVIIDRQGKVIESNRTSCERLGVERERLIGKSLYDLFSPEVTNNRREKWESVFKTGLPVSFRDTREGRHYEQNVYPVAGYGGEVDNVAVFARDITERSRTEEQLRYFEAAVELSSDAIGMSTPEGRHWYQNKAFDHLFGEIGEDPPASLYADVPVGREVFRVIMAGGQWTGEVRMHGKDGFIHDILLRAYAIKDEKGMIIGLVGTHTDVTDWKRAEAALRESEESLRAILLASPDPMVMYDMKGKPKFINSAFTEVFGWSLEELIGHRIPFVPDDQKDATFQEIERLYTSGLTSKMETRRLTKNGDIRDILLSAAVVKGPGQAPVGMVVNLTDITERKKLQAQFEQAQKMEAIGTLAGGIAHDFNNLLMGIQGRASLITLELDSFNPLLEHVRGIEECVRSASGLTMQLLGFARGGKYEVRPVDVNQIIQDSLTLFGRTRKELQIHTRMHDQSLVVEVDRHQIEQVMLNLYVNAWQAMPEGGKLFLSTKRVKLDEVFCKPHNAKPGDYAQLSVTDTGIGMDKEICRRIFDPFFTTREKSRGIGLGLASAYGIIKNHGGVITVYSEVGHGSTFHVYLPLSVKEVPQEAPIHRVLEKGDELILLVDDEEIVIEVAKTLLLKLGYEVLTARSGFEAIDWVKNRGKDIQLVVLDMIMPEMDGGETFNIIRELKPGIPVVLSSGYALDGKAAEIMKRGCNGFIQKPFSIADLSGKVRAILEESKHRADIPDENSR